MTSFLTPVVITAILSVAVFGAALSIADPAETWKALLAGLFIVAAASVVGWGKAYGHLTDLRERRIRLAFIVASVMVTSQLAFAVARSVGWFVEEGDVERWSMQWFIVAIVAAATEMLTTRKRSKRKQASRDSEPSDGSH